jgi:hypothetical protein
MTSNINPNNINGAYPVAGQDNNSQGFRDNFTNTATNFEFAAEEITELQSKAVLKAALTGTTLNNNMNGSPLSNALLSDMSEAQVQLGTVSGSVSINYALASYQTLTASAPVTLGFTNWPTAGTVGTVDVQVTITNVSQTLALPTNVGAGSSAISASTITGLNLGTNTITFAATGTYVYEFWSSDGGTTVYINDLTQSRDIGTITTISVTGNITAGNITTGNITTGNITAGNITGNAVGGTTAIFFGNVTGGNILATSSVSRRLDYDIPVLSNVTANAQTISLSTTNSINLLAINNTGYTTTLNMPTSPANGQICNFAVTGNTVTLVVGTGTVAPSFAGSATAGTGFRYVYYTTNSTWYKIG